MLPRWDVTDDFLRFLRRLAPRLLLRRPSDLADEHLATRLIAMTEGTIGEVMTLVAEAAVLAIDSGEECITAALLDRVDWIVPSQRGRPGARRGR